MPGCPACEEYSPRFEKMVDKFRKTGVPLEYYSPGRDIPVGQIPVIILDATSEDQSIQAFADQHAVSGMPTTMLLTSRHAPIKLEGAVEDQELYNLLVAAVQAR